MVGVRGVFPHLIEGMINHHYHLASSWWLQSSWEMSNISFSKIALNRGTILKHFATITYSKGLSKKPSFLTRRSLTLYGSFRPLVFRECSGPSDGHGSSISISRLQQHPPPDPHYVCPKYKRRWTRIGPINGRVASHPEFFLSHG